MPIIEQEFLRPGFYRVGGRPREYDADTLRRFKDGTNSAIRQGLHIPLLAKHARPGDPTGGPQTAAQFRGEDGRGWIQHIGQRRNGSLFFRAEVTDPTAANAIQNGSVRFSSPEFADNFIDGKGRQFGPIIRHVALVPAPRSPDQGPMNVVRFSEDDFLGETPEEAAKAAAQFDESESDDESASSGMEKPAVVRALLNGLGVYIPDDVSIDISGAQLDSVIESLELVDEVRKKAEKKRKEKEAEAKSEANEESKAEPVTAFAEDEQSKEPPKEPPPTPNADEQETNQATTDNSGPDLASLVQQAAEKLGAVIPEGVDPTSKEGFVIVLTALLNAGNKEGEAGGEEMTLDEEPAISAQFAEHSDPAVRKLAADFADLQSNLVAKKLAEGRAAISAKLAASGLPPGMRKTLGGIVEAVQFAESGDELPKLTVSEVVDLYHKFIPQNLQFAEDSIALAEDEHHSGDEFFEEEGVEKGHVSPERAKEIVDSVQNGQWRGHGPREYKAPDADANSAGVGNPAATSQATAVASPAAKRTTRKTGRPIGAPPKR